MNRLIVFRAWALIFTTVFTFSLSSGNRWIDYRNHTIEQGRSISGWCSEEQAYAMMEYIYQYKCRVAVEVGVFRGSSLLPIAQAIKYNATKYSKPGKVYGIDAWSCQQAVEGLLPDDSAFQWWMKLDMNAFYQETVTMLNQHQLQKQCKLIRKPANQAVKMFKNQSIDFIHFDGTRHEDLAYQEVVHYFPKVKNGGLIVLKDPMIRNMKQALVFLLERTDVISAFEPSVSYLVLRKNKKRSESVHELQLR